MLNQLKIKLHKMMLGKPVKGKFVNPYAKVETKYTPVVKPFVKAKKPLSFPFLKEIGEVVKDDIKRLQTPAGKVGDMIREHKSNQEKYCAFEELAYRGMR